MKTTTPMMKSALAAVVLGAALTALSMFHRWQGIDSVFRGFPFLFVNVIPGDSYQNSAGLGTDIWCLLGYRPLVADLVVWTFFACVCLRLVKGTASALIGVAAIQCAIGFLQWWKWHDYFGWVNWLIVIFTVSIYLLLGIRACRSQLAAALIGAGLYAPLVVFQAFQSADQLMSDLVFQIPSAVLLLVAVLFALRQKVGRMISDGEQQLPVSRQTV